MLSRVVNKTTCINGVQVVQKDDVTGCRRPQIPKAKGWRSIHFRVHLQFNSSSRITWERNDIQEYEFGDGGGGDGNFLQKYYRGSDDDGDGFRRCFTSFLVIATAVILGSACSAKALVAEIKDTNGASPKVSVIVPALNEAAVIASTIKRAKNLVPPPFEVIVVDGGSTDETTRIACKAGAKVIKAPKRGRAHQMNLGAKHAIGDILCFMHADTVSIPQELVSLVRDTLSDCRTACGGFRPLITSPGRVYRGLSMHNYIKSFYLPMIFRPASFAQGLRILFGDQVMFCRRNEFKQINGFNEQLAIMEDADLCIRLHHLSTDKNTRRAIKVLNHVAETSGRRFDVWGSWKATYVHFRIGLSWYAGMSNEELKRLCTKLYQDIR